MSTKTLTLVLALILSLLSLATNALKIALPFNAQVPPLARVSESYSYTLSASTFAPSSPWANLTYTLTNAPAWLSLTAPLTLTGTPSTSDAGIAEFTLVATDAATGEAVGMACTLVTSDSPPPVLSDDENGRPLESTLDARIAGATVRLQPEEAFAFSFERGSFIDIVPGRVLSFYATLGDRTPLPGWLRFLGEGERGLGFVGIAPGLLGEQTPMRWEVLVLAGEIEGFAGTEVGFTVVVGDDGSDGEGLQFAQELVRIGFVRGDDVEFRGLQRLLREGGVRVGVGAVQGMEAEGLPGWARLDRSELVITGVPGEGAGEQNATVTVADEEGTEASIVLQFVPEEEDDSLFAETMGDITARAGQNFEYQIPDSMLGGENLVVSVVLPPTATWLTFDADSLTLSGEVPSRPEETNIRGTLTARSPSDVQTQVFEIDIYQRAAETPSASNSLITSRATPTNTSTSSAIAGLLAVESSGQLAGGTIAAIVIVSAVATAMLLGLLFFCCCCRRRRAGGYERQARDSSEAKRKVSQPIPPPSQHMDGVLVTTQLQSDVEKLAGSPFERHMQTTWEQGQEQEQAPQIALNLPDRSARNSKWSSRFSRFSYVSSIGDGEAAIRGNDDIPEWGRESTILHTRHQSFSVPAEIARHSRRQSELSPSNRALRRLRERHLSTQSVGLGIGVEGGDGNLVVHTHGSKRSRQGRGTSSTGLSATMEGSSRCNSMSTRGTSLLSTKASDFPRPPTRSTFAHSKSRLNLTNAEKLKSIRLVGRSDSILDGRSIEDKRQSFIRNRRKSKLESPFLAHGSRGSSGNKLAQLTSTTEFESSHGDMRRSQRGRSGLTSYSESSSVEPFRGSRRLSQRVRSTFGPNFPRAITSSSLGKQQAPSQHLEVEKSGSSSSFYTTSSSISDTDLRDEMTLPRHQRIFVLPGEASPTPPPLIAPPTFRQPSGPRCTYTSSSSASGLGREAARQRWKDRLNRDSRGNIRDHPRPNSPLSTAIAVPAVPRNSLAASDRASRARRGRLSDPMNLVSQDSLSGGRCERPKLVHTSSGRPVSVEKGERLGSLRAESDEARAGGEKWEEGAGLMPGAADGVGTGRTGKSSVSGIAFL